MLLNPSRRKTYDTYKDLFAAVYKVTIEQTAEEHNRHIQRIVNEPPPKPWS